MAWDPWPRVDDRGLARYVTPKSARWLDLELNRFDLRGQPGERRRVVEAIYETLAKQRIRYALEAYHPGDAEQIIRAPHEVLEAPREGTCLDLAAVFCGLCLSFDLLPMLVVLDGHACAAVSLTHGLRDWDGYRPERPLFDRGPLTDARELCALVERGDYIAVECTGFAHSERLGSAVDDPLPEMLGREEGLLSFERAIAAGREQLENARRPFRFALDVAVAHYAWGVVPHATRDLRRSWTQLQRDAKEHTTRFLRETQGTSTHRGPFLREAYVRREAVETQLAAFLADDAPALALVGDPGVGKTSLICHWTERLMTAGHVVLVHDCATLTTVDVEALLRRTLSVAEETTIADAVRDLADLARVRERKCLIIFEALNEFHGDDRSDARQLRRQIDNLIRGIPDGHFKVVITCTPVMWRRLERADSSPTPASRASYFGPDAAHSYVTVERYSPEECGAAYEGYRAFFNLRTSFERLPIVLRERLRDPWVMRLLAETYRDRNEPITHGLVVQGILGQYFEDRVTREEDQLFTDFVASEMLRQRRSAIPVLSLARDGRFGRHVLDDGAASSYRRLIDAAILVEASGGPGRDKLVKFAHLEVGGHAVARHILRDRPAIDLAFLTELALDTGFPLGWSIARVLLLLADDSSLLSGLARASDIELRELCVETLVALHGERPEEALAALDRLLECDSVEARRTALRAAHRIGPGARSVFLTAMRSRSLHVRRAAKDTLYLVWRSDPAFTYEILAELVSGIRRTRPRELSRVLPFMLDLSVTIYINHCDRPDVVDHTADLWYDVLRTRLRLPVDRFPAPIEALLRVVADRAFSRPILESMLFGDKASFQRAFNLTPEERRSLRRVVPLLQPGRELRGFRDDLELLLRSDASVLNVAAALALAIQSYQSFDAVEPMSRALFGELDSHGRLWQLLAYAVLLPQSPAGWLEMLEEFTARLLESEPDVVFGGTNGGVPNGLDLTLLPLGLAYGRRGKGMPVLERYIRQELKRGGSPWPARCIAALGPLGFYYPDIALGALRRAVPDFRDPVLQAGLVECLATVRTLHLDAVDEFLQAIEAEPALSRGVAARADVERVQRYIYLVGMYNNAVHQAIHYPRMRRHLLMGGFQALIDARTPSEVLDSYTRTVMRMVREAGYQLREWTLPE